LSKFGGFGYASQIQVLFKSAEFFPLILQQKLTTLDFVSLCGGSLGLFLGFSAVSVIELVYFFTMRLIFRIKTRNRVQSFTRTDETEDSDKKTNYFVEIMKSSSIHGCNHAVCRDFHWIEKQDLFIKHPEFLDCFLSLVSFGSSRSSSFYPSAVQQLLESSKIIKMHRSSWSSKMLWILRRT
jgi:hypothetical protein